MCLAEEIETPGEGQVRALITIAGNPAVSNPDARRLDRAFAALDFMVSIDIYRNETTRHARRDPAAGAAPSRVATTTSRCYSLAIRNVANYSPPVFELEPDELPEWQIMLRLAAICAGQGAHADVDAFDDIDRRATSCTRRSRAPAATSKAATPTSCSPTLARAAEVRSACSTSCCAAVPYGDGFGTVAGGLSLDGLLANPHGVDLGPLQPRIPECLRTESGMIELAPEAIVADVDRLRGVARARTATGTLVLVGRRDLRSNNSWMHNVDVLVKGKERCTVHVHPDDARRNGIVDGARVVVASETGQVDAAGGGDRRGDARRREHPARLGPRRRGIAAARSRSGGRVRTATSSRAPTSSTRCRGTPCSTASPSR